METISALWKKLVIFCASEKVETRLGLARLRSSEALESGIRIRALATSSEKVKECMSVP